ncbi:hypothetical protein AB1Y20_017233 [Prymnesium parvum]|uniref:Uncharacterized protein n=1 Tax=Prymnesium parvum TaxID=97485 RepID=A0AB34I7Z6_PRYPA
MAPYPSRLILLLAPLSFAAATRRVDETSWIEPTLCRLPDASYVSYLPNASAAPLVGAAPPVIASCPPSPRALRIEFWPDSLDWPNRARNLSLAVYRSAGDHLAFSASLSDASRELWALPRLALEEEEEEEGEAPGRRLLFASRGQRRLLKGGSVAGGGGGAARPTPRRGTATGVPAWGSTAALPVRTAYGYSASHVVLAGTVVYLMHRRGYSAACVGAYGCEASVTTDLSRDEIASPFSLDDAVQWPLTLTLHVNVTREESGDPSVYFAFFAETPPEESSGLSFLHVLIVLGGALAFFLCCRLYASGVCDKSPPPPLHAIEMRGQPSYRSDHFSHAAAAEVVQGVPVASVGPAAEGVRRPHYC